MGQIKNLLLEAQDLGIEQPERYPLDLLPLAMSVQQLIDAGSDLVTFLDKNRQLPCEEWNAVAEVAHAVTAAGHRVQDVVTAQLTARALDDLAEADRFEQNWQGPTWH